MVQVGGTTDLVVGLVSLMLMLFLKTHRRQEVTGGRGFHLAIKRCFVDVRQCVAKSDSLCTVPEGAMVCVAMRMWCV